MENNEPATKRDLEALRDELLGAIDRTEQKLREELLEAIHDTETKLLRAFYSFAESNHKRIAYVETSVAGLAERLATVEGRVIEIEKRLNLPPAS